MAKKLKLKRQDMVVADKRLMQKIVRLGSAIRRYQGEGKLLSVPMPTMYGYLSFLRLKRGMPHFSLQQVANSTLLGNAGAEDKESVASVFNEVFGIRTETEGGDDPTLGGDLF